MFLYPRAPGGGGEILLGVLTLAETLHPKHCPVYHSGVCSGVYLRALRGGGEMLLGVLTPSEALHPAHCPVHDPAQVDQMLSHTSLRNIEFRRTD